MDSLRRRVGRHLASARLLTALFASVLLAALAGSAAAHQVGTRFDAPLPLSLLFAGAGATVATTALLLGRVGDAPTWRRRLLSVPADVARPLRLVARVWFLLVVGAAVLDGVFGPRAPLANAATLVVWPLWLKGLGLVSVLVGSPWRTLSPARTLYEGLAWLEGEELRFTPYPERLAEWPAVVGFVVLVGVVENLTVVPARPRLTAAVVVGYVLVTLLGGVAFGREWFERADPLAVLYRLLGRVAPITISRTDDGGWTVDARVPWQGCLDRVTPATAAFVVAAVYTVSFDGFAESTAYQSLFFATRRALGVGPSVSVALFALGLGGFLLTFVAVARLAGRAGGFDHPATTLAASVVPIAAAYEVAHTYSYVLTYLGQLPRALGLGTVDPLFFLSLPAFWASQVALVVAGHVVAVVAAHEAVERRVGADRRALVAHAPLVVLMVGYTVLSLWIVSRPVAA
ncbi:hypothetical protein ACFO0N_02165 [Halobium salinum]|uniref:Uncharacterized protein n=1 Tax=Halobium salinum TaxID=1364940 RepID=A0ABD5P7P3_9EURY|nr:hypothetical protein [Halobium salinum]